jgi:hypothetical protein
MIAAFVLIIGVMVILVVGSVFLSVIGYSKIVISLIPLAPGLVTLGCIFLILSELLLFFGNREDKKTAIKDLKFLFPTLIIFGFLWYLSQYLLW